MIPLHCDALSLYYCALESKACAHIIRQSFRSEVKNESVLGGVGARARVCVCVCVCGTAQRRQHLRVTFWESRQLVSHQLDEVVWGDRGSHKGRRERGKEGEESVRRMDKMQKEGAQEQGGLRQLALIDNKDRSFGQAYREGLSLSAKITVQDGVKGRMCPSV